MEALGMGSLKGDFQDEFVQDDVLAERYNPEVTTEHSVVFDQRRALAGYLLGERMGDKQGAGR